MPHISYREDSGNIGFEKKWISIESPSFGTIPGANEIWPSKNESALITLDHISEPVSLRQCAYKNKDATCRHSFHLVGVGTENRNFLEMRVAMHFGDAGIRPQLNFWRLLNLINQIFRHGAGKGTPSHQYDHLVGVLGEIHRRLARRVCAADHVDNFTLARQCFGGPSTVINARALQTIDSGSVESPPLNSAGNHQRVTGNLATVGQFQDSVRSLGPHRR